MLLQTRIIINTICKLSSLSLMHFEGIMLSTSPKSLILLALLSLSLCTTTLASPFYIGGYIGESKIQDDQFFDQVENEPDTDYTSSSYSLLVGVIIKQNLLLEFEAGTIAPYISESSLSFSYEELSIENNFLRINLLQTFPLPGDYYWYIKESLGIISVKQSYTNATGKVKKQVKTKTIFPGISLGILQAFIYRRQKLNAYLEIQYSGYNLENDNNAYHIRQHSLGAGVKWQF
jgi:hypothetical protein